MQRVEAARRVSLGPAVLAPRKRYPAGLGRVHDPVLGVNGTSIEAKHIEMKIPENAEIFNGSYVGKARVPAGEGNGVAARARTAWIGQERLRHR